MSIEAILLLWIFCAMIAGGIGHSKNRTGQGIVLGGLFGIFGIIAILFFSEKEE